MAFGFHSKFRHAFGFRASYLFFSPSFILGLDLVFTIDSLFIYALSRRLVETAKQPAPENIRSRQSRYFMP